MRHLKYLFILFLALVVPVSAEKIDTDVLIFTNDNGDAVDLLKVAEKLKEMGIGYKIAAIGVSAEKLKDDPNYVNFTQTCNLDVSLDGKLAATLQLSAEDLEKVNEDVDVYLCVIPMSHRVFADISTALSSFTKVVAYYDNMDSMKTAKFVQPFLEAPKRVNVVIVPSEKTLKESEGVEGLDQAKIVVLGKPSLDDWEKLKDAISYKDQRRFLNRMAIRPEQKPAILFAGGRGQDYETYFPIFVEGIKDLDVQVWVTHHPATDGSFEHRIIAGHKAENIKVYSKQPEIGLHDPTAQLSPFATMLACNQSSVDIKAAYMGLPVLYVNGPSYNPTMCDIAELASTPEEVKVAVTKILANPNKPDLKKIGVPRDAADKIAEFIRDNLPK